MAGGREASETLSEPPPWWRTVPLMLAVLLAGALGLILFLAAKAGEERDRAIARQQHSFEVMMLAEQLEGTLANAEVLLARYVVSLDKTIGRQFQAEWRTALAEVTALDRATRDSAEQQENVKALREAITERGKTLNDIALRTTYKQRLGALGRFYAAGKAPTVTAVKDALKRAIAHEREELARRSDIVSRSELQMSRVNSSYIMMGVALLAAALLALWFAYGAARERLFERRLALAEAARVDGLEAAVQQRTEELQQANAQLRREMSERERAEQNVRQLQKMEAIGKLTGGIAHDFNNMLAVIVSGVELASRALGRDPAKARRHLKAAMEGADRAATLTSRLLAFARPSPTGVRRVAIDVLVDGMHPLIDRATDDRLTVQLDLDAGGWAVWVDPAQLENAILNLAINARDAMGGRGTLTITTRPMTLAEHEIGQCRAGEYVCIGVTDTGCGMAPEVIERAFEPFFTTKPVGKGTGLGLSTIFSFVRASGGEIDIQSAPDQGATVRMLLPRREGLPMPEAEDVARGDRVGSVAHAPALEEPGDPSEQPDRRGDLVLVVEDDPRVLRATLAGLAALGYRGLSCNHPHKAAGLLARHPETALILSDVLMPDMTGPEMIAALASTQLAKPIIFVTGFAGDSEDVAQMSGAPILRKPFTQAQLASAIENALRHSRQGRLVPPLH